MDTPADWMVEFKGSLEKSGHRVHGAADCLALRFGNYLTVSRDRIERRAARVHAMASALHRRAHLGTISTLRRAAISALSSRPEMHNCRNFSRNSRIRGSCTHDERFRIFPVS
eukprot:6167021-Pleurochrysis_carterae.AAC.2